MISQKSQLQVNSEKHSYILTCDPDSDIQEVKLALAEMQKYVDGVIASHQEKEENKEIKECPDTEQTL